MAGDVTQGTTTAPAAPVEDSGQPLVERVPAREQATLPYPLRFRLAYFALAIVLGAGVGSFVLFLGWPDSQARPFSAWAPTKQGDARAWEIADFVSGRYHDRSGQKLVDVSVGRPTAQFSAGDGTTEEVPIEAIFVRGRARDFSDASAVRISQDRSLMFILCGGGENCTLPGNPSRERGELLRREILELALYSYRYVDDLEHVVALMPPAQVSGTNGQTSEIQRAVFLRRDDFGAALDRPLRATLPGRPTLPLQRRDTRTVDQLVLPHLFQSRVERAPQGDALLILAPFVS